MPINAWWTGEPEQRYWMEITDRVDLGGPLLSPKLPRLTWGYDLVSQVQPGDRVLHWSTQTRLPALVGWSEVAGHATVIPEYTWIPRHGEERTTLGWRAELGTFHQFPSPVTSKQLLPRLADIVAVDLALGARHNGTLYFPLTRYGSNRATAEQEIRAAQAYFVKFPVELFDVIPGIDNARIEGVVVPTDVDIPEDFQPSSKQAPPGRTVRAQDPKLRAAVERRALDVARDYYENDLGGTNYEEVGAPYDIRVTIDGVVRHCEVKGSSVLVQAIDLTINEVNHPLAHPAMDLIVVDGIEAVRDAQTGEVVGALGGRRRVWTDWSPTSGLTPTRFTYELPPLAKH